MAGAGASTLAAGASRGAPPARSVGSQVWRRLRRDPVSLAAIATIAGLTVVAIFAPWIAPYDPNATDISAVLEPPSWAHPLGTDTYGRDQLSRIMHAARIDLLIPSAATLAGLLIGCSIGAISGYRGGWLDQVVMRAVEAVMAFPALVLAMGLTAALGSSTGNLVVVIAVTQIPVYLRLIRGEMLRVRNMEYAEAARTVGNGDGRIVFVHLVPNCIAPIIVQATLAMGYGLLTMAALSFLGLGVRPPNSEWGEMTAEGASQIVTGEWWLFVFPGLAIIVCVLAFNLIGDALRDLLDPRLRGIK